MSKTLRETMSMADQAPWGYESWGLGALGAKPLGYVCVAAHPALPQQLCSQEITFSLNTESTYI